MLLKEGDKAPEFTLPSESGTEISLNDYKNKKIVLWFFPKANTPGWTIEGQGFRDEFETFKKNNIIILGCSADTQKKQQNFCEKQNFPFSILSDESHQMMENYGVWGLKKFMGREYMGIMRVTYVISESGVIEKVYDKVSTKTHAKDIIKDLEL